MTDIQNNQLSSNSKLSKTSTRISSQGIRTFHCNQQQLFVLYNCSAIEHMASSQILDELQQVLHHRSNDYSIIYIHYNLQNLLKFWAVIVKLSAQNLQGLGSIHMIEMGIIGIIITKFFTTGARESLRNKVKAYSSVVQFSVIFGAKNIEGSQSVKSGKTYQRVLQILQNNQNCSEKLLQFFVSNKRFDCDNIPNNLSIVITRIYSDRKIILSEGLFRKSPCKLDMLQFENVLKNDDNPWGYLKQIKNPSVLTTLFKKILLSYGSLIPESVTEELNSHYLSYKSRIPHPVLKQTLSKISRSNQHIIIYCLAFLSQVLATKQDKNMTSKSLSIILSPCFFKLKQDSLQQISKITRCAQILQLILENYKLIFCQRHVEQCLQKLKLDKNKFNAQFR